MATREEIRAAATEEQERFLFAIGRFTLAWADMESALYSVLRYYAKVTDDIGRAIFSGSRAKTMMEFVEAIAHNTNLEKPRRDDLEDVFGQLKSIGTMRDRLTHHVDGSEQRFEEHDPGRRYLTNARRVMRKGREFEVLIGSQDIETMRQDVFACCWRLLAHKNDLFVPEYIAGNTFTSVPQPWLYKPPQPVVKKSRSAASPPQPQRQPKSSRASPKKE